MFAGIAGRYDFANHMLSGGMDFLWRRKLAALVAEQQPADLVDLATGSGDVAFTLRAKLGQQVPITGLDFCQPMLDEAEAKKLRSEATRDIIFRQGDCLNLPLEDCCTDAVTIAFGLRNLEDRHRGLTEMLRILRPGGKLYILEFTQPYRWFSPFYYCYLKFILPIVASIATGKKSAYEYLAGSIESFPTRAAIAEEITRAGFREVRDIPLTFSTVAIHVATK